METDLKLASQRRRQLALAEAPTEELSRIDLALEVLLLNAEKASPKDRKKLKGILKHYAKMAHPFRACVRDNTKRFGKEGAERVCATLKDIIRGTKKWRGKDNPKDKGSKGLTGLSEEEDFLIDDELFDLLERLAITDDQIAAAEEILDSTWKGGGSS